jgi:LPS sulfotransferase NodH
MGRRGDLRTLVWTARKRAVRDLNRLLAPLETIGAREDPALPYRPVFVVGPPRSGTTLLVQVMIAAFDVGYFSNFLNALWGVPSWAARLVRIAGLRPRIEFRSDLGNTTTWLGFSEGPNYWLRFFPERPQTVSAEDVSPESRARLRAAVGRLVRAIGKPVVFKTIANTGRLRPLAAALPEALFIVSRRDALEIGHSLLEARRHAHGSYDTWLSYEPPGIEAFRTRPPYEQVIEQTLRSYDVIRSDVAAIGPERFLEIDYHDLCGDPRAVVARIERFTSLPRRSTASRQAIPESFPYRTAVRIPEELHRKMVGYHQSRVGAERERSAG